ncbi:MAG TPA: restriction endonuclease subunit S [Rhodoferax sp.]
MNKQTADSLEQHFDTAFAAPDGIKKLRELILTLAMQGKLVPQDPNDPPASQLLKEIEAEKKRLVKAGKIKVPKPLPEIKAEEVPYALPMGWKWVRVRDICHDWGQKTPDSRFTYIDVGSIDNTAGVIGKEVQILEDHEAPSRARKLVQKGTVIYSTVRPYLLNIAIVEGEFEHEPIASTAFAILHPFIGISNRFIYSYLRSPIFIKYVESTMKGVAYPAINDGDFFQGVFPLPPIPEQRRIVAKIDQLMARCDELEKLRNEREQKRRSVHAAALKKLLDAPAGDSFTDAWQFITHHFGELYAVRENVTELRKTILQLAVMGKLVPQNPNDPPASQLLKEIEAEKKCLIKEGRIRGMRSLEDAKKITQEEIPYALPQGWAWVRLSSVFNTTSGNTFDAALEKEIGAVAYVKVGDMNLPGNELLITTSSRFIDPDERMSRSLIPTGSIIFPKRGGAIATNKKRIVGNPIFVDLNTMAITPIKGVETDYAYLWLLTIDLATLNTGTSVPQINHKDIDPLPFPLPPFKEQHRIVAKIDQLMALCDTLEHRINAATGKQTELLGAMMAQV